MRCIYCGEKTRTVNSRSTGGGLATWRRRQCKACKAIFTTDEAADMGLAIRVEKDTALEPFLQEKLFISVYDSVSHRKTAYTDAKQLCATIVSRLIPCKTGVLGKAEISQAAMEVLTRFDKTAYTHYKARHS